MDKKICSLVADRIISALDNGVVPWRKPWVGGYQLATSYVTRKPYSLLNQILLANPTEYITFKQAQSLGGRVKKGAKASKVVFWNILNYDADGKIIKDWNEAREKGVKIAKKVPYLKEWSVFNIADCEGIEPHSDELPKGATKDLDAEKVVTDYMTREMIEIRRDGLSAQAYYSLRSDSITVPSIDQFEKTSEYYSTLFHECVHSTGKEGRLNRFATDDAAQCSFGSDSYSREELVAEIGAASLVNALGLETEDSFQNSAAYLKHWRDKIAEDNSLIITAAGRAEKAFQFILNGKKDD